MKAYPAYQETDIIWLGKIPASWQVKRIKHNTYVKGRIGWQGLNTNEYWNVGPYLVTGTDFDAGRISWDTCHHISEERYAEDPYIQLQEKDLLITKDGTIGKIALVDHLPDKATLNSGVFVTRPQNNDYITPFMYWVLNSAVFNTFIDYIKMGSTIQHLYQRTFVEFSYPLPSIPEQQAIADFLDCKTAQIDTLIEKKQQQIDLLQEQRIVLINQAVTKGLNPDAPMKDSRVEWLGQIPSHWKNVRLKFLTREIVDTEHKTAPFYDGGEYFIVRTSNIRNGKLIFENAKYTNSEGYEEWTRRGIPEPGDVIFTREAPAGEACIVPDNLPIAIGQRTVLFRLKKELFDAEFCIWSIYGGETSEFIKLLSQGSTVAHFNMSDIRDMPFLVPSLEEQKAISSYITSATKRIDSGIDEIISQINNLKEYRTALISEAVTGKIDVRK